MDTTSQILSHFARLDSVNASFLEEVRPAVEW